MDITTLQFMPIYRTFKSIYAAQIQLISTCLLHASFNQLSMSWCLILISPLLAAIVDCSNYNSYITKITNYVSNILQPLLIHDNL